jgi:hypothetical protein
MTPAPDLTGLLGELRDGPIPLASAAEVAAQRERLLPQLREQVRSAPARDRRRRRIQWGLGALASLSGIAAGWLLTTQLAEHEEGVVQPAVAELRVDPLGGSVALTKTGSGSVAVHQSAIIAARGELRAHESASLTTSQGVMVELAKETHVGLDALSPSAGRARLKLVSGSVTCAVPPLGDAQTFSVVTADAEVVVHGTQFSVAAPPSSDAATCVRVREGLVEVRHEGSSVFLAEGQSWGCAPAPAATPAAEAPAPQDPSNAKQQTAPAPRANARASRVALDSPPTGTLEAESRLIAVALSAERQGKAQAARRLYKKLITRYPDSPLAPDARRGLRRLDR